MIKKFEAIEFEVREFGFEWPNIEMIFEQILSELDEVKNAISNNESHDRVQEEIGDLIESCISLYIFASFSIEETLGKLNKKFGSRVELLKKLALERGLESLRGLSFEESLKLWGEVKKLEKLQHEIA